MKSPALPNLPNHFPTQAQISDICVYQEPEAFSILGTRPGGLNQDEVEERLHYYGLNVITKVKGKSLWIRFLANFTHVMALLLWVGGIVGFIAKMPELGIAIWMVNLINGLFSFWQEFRAEKATEALRNLLPSYARVLRNGENQRILAEELVPGDVILIEEGDRLSADARLFVENELRIDQSTLSGESNPVRKISDPVQKENLTSTELPNILYAGTMVSAGTGRAIVYATGMNTEFGKIAHLTQTVGEELSPLQKEMQRVTKSITILAVSIGVLFFILGIFLAGVNLLESFIFAMGMIVAFVPEGLLPTVTLSLAMGVQRMAHKHALIKKLSAVETLGCTTVICTDKTGTLTQNEMTVTGIWLPDEKYSITGVGYLPKGEILPIGKNNGGHSFGEDVQMLLIAAGLCNNARLVPPTNETPNWSILGDPTEASILIAAKKGGIELDNEALLTPRLRELPFDSHRKRMSTIHQNQDTLSIYVKGAPKEVLDLCSNVRKDGQIQPLDTNLRVQIMAANDDYARDGLRVLAIAARNMPDSTTGWKEQSSVTIESDLTFLGLVAMMDPPRAEVADAIKQCHSAGIRIIMITGDYGLTAESIARRIGIVRTKDLKVITGLDLDSLDDDALKESLSHEVIFARAAPEHKLRVVTALKEMGEIVAVTGDGVNDAPALKKADIGIAMGVSGTDVAKEAADMILTDDNFASIVHAVEEGRAVYSNIRKFATYVITSNMPEAVPFVMMLFSRGAIPLPLTIMQILAIDLGTDMVPAMGLGTESPEAGTMMRPPRSQKEPLLSSKLLAKALLWYGIIESITSISAYFFLNWQHGWPGVPLAAEGTLTYRMATTMVLAGVVTTQIGAVLCRRSEYTSIFRIGLFSNRLVLFGIAVELTLLSILIYTPFLQPIFNTAAIGAKDWLFLFALPPIFVLFDELDKVRLRKRERRASLNARQMGEER
ncbi:MAG: cation-translocating P-type ATPase [Flexilinea sp.]